MYLYETIAVSVCHLIPMITVRLAHGKEVGFTAVITTAHAVCVVCVAGVGRGGHPGQIYMAWSN